eukprot:6305458-Amphidinium_carterae.1
MTCVVKANTRSILLQNDLAAKAAQAGLSVSIVLGVGFSSLDAPNHSVSFAILCRMEQPIHQKRSRQHACVL